MVRGAFEALRDVCEGVDRVKKERIAETDATASAMHRRAKTEADLAVVKMRLRQAELELSRVTEWSTMLARVLPRLKLIGEHIHALPDLHSFKKALTAEDYVNCEELFGSCLATQTSYESLLTFWESERQRLSGVVDDLRSEEETLTEDLRRAVVFQDATERLCEMAENEESQFWKAKLEARESANAKAILDYSDGYHDLLATFLSKRDEAVSQNGASTHPSTCSTTSH